MKSVLVNSWQVSYGLPLSVLQCTGRHCGSLRAVLPRDRRGESIDGGGEFGGQSGGAAVDALRRLPAQPQADAARRWLAGTPVFCQVRPSLSGINRPALLNCLRSSRGVAVGGLALY